MCECETTKQIWAVPRVGTVGNEILHCFLTMSSGEMQIISSLSGIIFLWEKNTCQGSQLLMKSITLKIAPHQPSSVPGNGWPQKPSIPTLNNPSFYKVPKLLTCPLTANHDSNCQTYLKITQKVSPTFKTSTLERALANHKLFQCFLFLVYKTCFPF